MSRNVSLALNEATNRGPICIGLGLAVVLIAQFLPMVPLATAIALIGLGATFVLAEHRQHELLLSFNLLTYVALVALAIAAQFHVQISGLVIVDALLATAIVAYTLPCKSFASRRR